MVKANEVLNNPEATKEEVEVAIAELTKALSGLETKPGSTVDTSTPVKPGDKTAGVAIASLGVYGSKKRKRIN